jgi:hypothetical protein
MSDSQTYTPRSRARPRSKSFLTLSLDNPYARLGVSPLAPTSEIADLIDQRRSEANRRLKAKPLRAKDDPDERLVLELDEISEAIGDDRRRERYDAQNPQNILLTVQPSASEQAWRRQGRAGLISDWINEVAADETLLPTPRCVKLWAPGGVEPALRALLAEFVRETPSADARPAEATAQILSVRDLDSLTKGS